ncbi:metallophosphoesterase [Candidatus Woesearchaeota archaeon]|nr:metallophosphoesterase [Candidatus Woesearchaeota archaeon]
MEILPNIEIVNLALYFKSTLVIADVHIGYEESLNKQGVLVPRIQFEEMVNRINSIFNTLKNKKIERIVVNGDLKHEFGTISEQEWRNTLKFLDSLAKHCNEVVLIKGNHDTILGPIAKKRNVKVLEYYVVEPIAVESINEKNTITIKNNKKITKQNKTLIVHGNKIPDKALLKDISTIVIGHEHPAVSLKEGPRVEQFKCFLKGKYKDKNLIVQPSFNSIVEGTDILRDEILSPFLKQNLDNFDVYIVEDKVYKFGKLKGLRKS